MNLIAKTKKDIQDLDKVQGASNVALVILKTLKIYSKTASKKEIKQAAKVLLSARPTEPLAQNLVKYVLKNNDFDGAIAIINDTRAKAAENAAKIVKKGDNIMTHCHSSAVIKFFEKARDKQIKVFHTETRPLYQGHKTAKDLIKLGIPATMVIDSSDGFLISKYSGKDLMMDKIMIGCDAILEDGSIVNKVGSFEMSAVAFIEKVPFYIVTPLLKYHPKDMIKIEERSGKEIWKNAPARLKIINFAFDKVPAKYITGIICEFGIIKPKNVKKTIKKYYPWLD
jgi:ribose 1,5-bisphosphate isomerase